jgi:hypothetical protein
MDEVREEVRGGRRRGGGVGGERDERGRRKRERKEREQKYERKEGRIGQDRGEGGKPLRRKKSLHGKAVFGRKEGRDGY